MSRDPDANAPAAAPEPPSEESVVRSPTSHRDDDASSDEEHVRDVDPHPDTPDDFDEDASSPRQSEEAIPQDDRDD